MIVSTGTKMVFDNNQHPYMVLKKKKFNKLEQKGT